MRGCRTYSRSKNLHLHFKIYAYGNMLNAWNVSLLLDLSRSQSWHIQLLQILLGQPRAFTITNSTID